MNMQISAKWLLIVAATIAVTIQDAFYSTCPEAANRDCPNAENQTDFLLNMKKGGSDILSTNTYMYDFMLCEQFNYDCGYQENSESYTTVSNGVELTMNQTKLLEIFQSNNQTLSDKLTPYLQTKSEQARCGMNLFPLTLTADESKLFLDFYMADLQAQLITQYDAARDALTTKTWPSLNINIRTAVLYMMRKYPSWMGSGTFWAELIVNNFAQVSSTIKKSYESTKALQQLHASYLIDSVTIPCNKHQSVNFLVDQSGSIGTFNFETYVRGFLQLYINTTNDDLNMVSLHFYDGAFEEYLGYGNDYNTFITQIRNKPHRAGGTFTGAAINATIVEMQKGNFLNGVPRIMAVMTDGNSFDDVKFASDYARSFGITMIAISVGANTNDTQLLQIAQTPSNIIRIDSYDKIEESVEFLSNYFCKQLLTVRLGDQIDGNVVRTPTSPSYFRVIKSVDDQYYELDIEYENDPVAHSEEVVESQIDPFPDEYTEYNETEVYELFSRRPQNLGRPDFQLVGSTPKKVYFIKPSNIVRVNTKKNNYVDVNATVSYVAVRGVNLGFNLSLKSCTTLTCEEERALYRSQSSFIKSLTPVEDLSIFIVIGSALGVLACLSILLIFAIRRFRQEEDKKKKQPIENTEENLECGIIPQNSGDPVRSEHKSNKSKSEKSRKSQKSSKSSKRSSKSSRSSSSKKSNSSD